MVTMFHKEMLKMQLEVVMDTTSMVTGLEWNSRGCHPKEEGIRRGGAAAAAQCL